MDKGKCLVLPQVPGKYTPQGSQFLVCKPGFSLDSATLHQCGGSLPMWHHVPFGARAACAQRTTLSSLLQC
jgi:hypothetical protein